MTITDTTQVHPDVDGEKLKTVTVRVWRQANPEVEGRFAEYRVDEVSDDMSFLEMLDVLNERLILEGEDPVAFDHDCREGICGSCGMCIDGRAHGPVQTTTCQLHMREFADGATIEVEPWRSAAFPVIKDLVVDRTAFDRIIGAGGYISIPTGSAPEANNIPIPKPVADEAFANATCIGCGACVAACPNGSAMLFTSAKLKHLNSLPQGQPERQSRTLNMVEQMDAEGFGGCTNSGECVASCPKEIPFFSIVDMNKEFRRAVRGK